MFKRALYKLAFLGLIYALVSLFADPILRCAAERAGQKAFGAKVEIGNLDAGLFPPRLELTNVAVADASAPMSNLLEFERAAFSLEGRPLLQKKFIVGEASLTGLRLQTPRKTSGALPGAAAVPESEGPSLTDKAKASAGEFSMEKVGQAKEGLQASYEIKKEDLESYKLAQALQDRYTAKVDDWEKKWTQADFDGRAAKVKAGFDKAQAEDDKLKKIKLFQKALKESKALADEAKAFEKGFKEDLAKANSDLQAVQDARRRDTDLVMSKLKLPSLDAESLSRFLLGPETADKVQKALYWLRWARANMPASAQKPPPPVRGQGTTVSFPVDRAYPRWAIRKLSLSGELPMAGAALAVEGLASGLTAEQALLGQPAKLQLASSKASAAAFKFDAVFDHRTDQPVDTVVLSYDGIPVGPRTLGNAGSIALQVSEGVGSLSVDIAARGEDLDGKIVFAQRGVTLTPALGPKGGGDLVKRAAAGAFSGINRFDATVRMKGTLSKPDLGVSSSLGTAFADGLKKALGGELDARKKQVEARIQGLVGEKTDAAQKTLDQKSGSLLGKLGKNGDAAKGFEKKVQDAIDATQKSLLPGGGKSPDLKKLFKR